jgi:hypothetical protein
MPQARFRQCRMVSIWSTEGKERPCFLSSFAIIAMSIKTCALLVDTRAAYGQNIVAVFASSLAYTFAPAGGWKKYYAVSIMP